MLQRMINDSMPIYILFMYPNICYDKYSNPFIVVVVYLWCMYSWGADTQDEEL